MIHPRAALFAIIACLGAVPATAHHSFAMFDITKQTDLKGMIRAVHWSNPHIWIDIDVIQPGGVVTPWRVEAGATNTLTRQGWKRDSVKPGDHVTLEVHPLRDGTNGGSLMKATLADGTTLTLGAQGARSY